METGERILTQCAWSGSPEKVISRLGDLNLADAIAGLEKRNDDVMPDSFAEKVLGLLLLEAATRFGYQFAGHSEQKEGA